MVRTKTLDQVKAMQRKAVRFVDNVLDDAELANEIEDLSPEEYAERKHIRVNPQPKNKEKCNMPGPTKQELQDTLNEVGEKLTEMLNPAFTRIDLIEKIQELDELVNGSEDSDDDPDSESDPDEDEE